MTKHFNYQLKSLQSICANYVVDNLAEIIKFDEDSLQCLPGIVKDDLLKKFTVSSYFWRNLNFKKALSLLLHRETKKINLTNVIIDDEMLEIIGLCKELKDLNIGYIGTISATEKGLINFFANLHQLQAVIISNCNSFDDDVLSALLENNPKLISLDIRGSSKISDKSLLKLANLNHLLCLNLSNTKITNDGLTRILKGPSGQELIELRISSCQNLTETILKTITDCCPSLQFLIFSNNYLEQFGEQLENEKLKKLKQLTWTISW